MRVLGPSFEVDRWGFALSGRTLALNWRASRDQLGQAAQILYSGGQGELVFGAAEASEPQAIELEDALQMREQHLDLLAFAH